MTADIARPKYWDDDKLKRFEQAQLLKSFLAEQYERGFKSEDGNRSFVLNLDAESGYGKTFFLDRFSKDLEQEHFVLRYNAWANDYAKDPLLSFISQIARELSNYISEHGSDTNTNKLITHELYQNALKVLKTAGKAAAPKLLTAGISTLVLGMPIMANFTSDSETSGVTDPHSAISDDNQVLIKESISASIEGAMASTSSALFDEENSRRAAIESFRKTLARVVEILTTKTALSSKKAPIYILIDELDRCRPDFTIELIECIKHLFSVDGVYFIFATDGAQLQHALSGLYGERFNAEIYFNRIFNREIGLHVPDSKSLAESLIDEYGLSDTEILNNAFVYSFENADCKATNIYEYFTIISDYFSLDLRSQKRVLSAFSTLLLARSHRGEMTHTIPALFLIVLWQRKKSLFRFLHKAPDQKSHKSPTRLHDLMDRFSSVSEHTRSDINLSIELNSSDNGGRTTTSIVSVLNEFLRILSYSPQRFRVKFEKNHSNLNHSSPKERYIYVLERQVYEAGINGKRNPLILYFEEITMVS
ncbi:KAP family P-loop NTPase fold protein [Marinobacter sp. F3R08]|uniref:KAP family P-loop NTPase fold protein n=1 Tax=Marinobacter sp. F3R08 TaxID=2841559 RepID=UPI001C085053|nr:P-loop NTPase fold protein [Marinobacter sp. F3R08]MBU2952301.1 KAP family NTPase [Marinobacter sp. F3R08]